MLATLVCAGTPACELFGSSKVASGQLYQSEDQRYDPYFDNVHQAQVAAAAWPDEKKATRRPLVNALALTPAASDDTLVSATRERAKKLGGSAKLDLASAHVTASGGANDGPLFAALEETVRLELERARKLKASSDKLDEMSKHGEELKKSADKEFENRGADKADEKKTQKLREIRNELGGAVDVTRSLSRDALKASKDAQDFLEDLGDALEAKESAARGRDKHREAKPLPPPPAKGEEKKPEEAPKPAETKPAAKKPAPAAGKPKPAEKPVPAAEKAAPAEKPAPKPAPPPDEVFNP